MSNTNKEKCTVGYVVGVLDGRVYGYRLFNLIECCVEFHIWFNRTGNSKYRNFNVSTSDEKTGINLVSRAGSLKLVLRHYDRVGLEHEIKFCPFCGKEVELVEACKVRLISVEKTEHDHYEEEIIRRNPAVPLPSVD